MEFMDTIWQSISQYINIPYLVVFMMFSYLVKKNFQDMLDKITKIKWRPVYTVLIIATLIGIPFIIFDRTKWQTVLVSYAIGTSLHELIFSWIENKFKKK